MAAQSDYRWQVAVWDPQQGWVPDGNACLSSGITTRCGDSGEEAAARILGNWVRDAGSAAGPWRVTVWRYDPGRPPGDPIATAEGDPRGDQAAT
jgi:hypothetical protein